MIDAGHIRREPDPMDRRKTLLRYEKPGMALARSFFNPLGSELRSALADLPDRDLAAAHRVFMAMVAAMATFESQLGALNSKAAPADKFAAAKSRRR
jgi:DNA-binding MarR family transcriptional regulator